MPRALIYTRVSSEQQVKNFSLDTQMKRCRHYCETRGIAVAGTFVEEGESARTTERTELKKLLAYCREKKGRIDFVVVYAINRFARDAQQHLALRICLHHGARNEGVVARTGFEPVLPA
ncbi:MAG: recombinase family protein [bacterium]|nr:recombinase family protein [bacterium]